MKDLFFEEMPMYSNRGLVVAWLLAAAVAGCSGSETKNGQSGASRDPGTARGGLEAKLVGTWEGTPEAPTVEAGGESIQIGIDPAEMKMTFQFNQDGTLQMTLPLFEIPVNGTWEVVKSEGKTLVLKTVLEMPKFEFSVQGEGDKVEESTTVTTEKQEDELTAVFESDDQMSLTSKQDPEPLKLTRKK